MNQWMITLILGFLTFASGGGVTWLIARRTSSGQINTSDAEMLWKENSEFRQTLVDEITSLRANGDALRMSLDSARAMIVTLTQALADSSKQLAEYEVEIQRLIVKEQASRASRARKSSNDN